MAHECLEERGITEIYKPTGADSVVALWCRSSVGTAPPFPSLELPIGATLAPLVRGTATQGRMYSFPSPVLPADLLSPSLHPEPSSSSGVHGVGNHARLTRYVAPSPRCCRVL